ncbi:MAG: hypothetical protein QOD85_2259 [Gaiellaceae bacterium]|nr:hypothetical protein [Gaiellaceae bacterium]
MEEGTGVVLASKPAERDWPRLDPPNVLWFAGTYALVVGSYALLDTLPSSHSSLWILVGAVGFVLLYAVVSWQLLDTSWWVPGGLAAALAVAMFPGACVALLRLIDAWSTEFPFTRFNGCAVGIAVATAAAGLVAFRLTGFPFLFFTVVAAGIVVAQFLVTWDNEPPSNRDRATAALVAGSLLVVAGIFLDAFGRRREAFWFHAGGLLSVAAGFSYFVLGPSGDPNRGWIPMLVVGAVLAVVSGPIRRATWALYGVLGYYAALAHYLLAGLNERRWTFALALLGVGLSIFALGLLEHRYGKVWAERFVRRPPPVSP